MPTFFKQYPFKGWVLLSLYLACTSSSLSQTNQPNPSTTATVLTKEGTVEVKNFGIERWIPARTNQVMQLRDLIRTSFKSRASVRLTDQSVLRMSQLTTVQILPPKKSTDRNLINFQRGLSYLLNREDPGTTEFVTPSASGAIRGTEFHVAVDDNGATVITMIDGSVDLTNDFGSLNITSGEQATVDPGQAPRKTAVLDAINIIQWALYYPGILDINELPPLNPAFNESVRAYRVGNLLQALDSLPATSPDTNPATRIYTAAVLLAVGLVDEATTQIQGLMVNGGTDSTQQSELASALRKLIVAVKNQQWEDEKGLETATGWMAESYYRQSRGDLGGAMEAALEATNRSPEFGFAWVRLAELEFGFGLRKRATEHMLKGLEYAPENAQALTLQGFLAAAGNEFHAATLYFDKAISLDPALGNAWLGKGLLKIHAGEVSEGRADIQTAAALEPTRAVFRSYLGKAWNNQGDNPRGMKELGLAKKLDPSDPTSWLYSAIINREQNRINEAISDMTYSKDLNQNRRVFRSSSLLDQDQAVRGVNLANMYRDVGMTEFSIREATRAVNYDYANASAHLFLANSYYEKRDLYGVNNRYETPWLNELLLANLMAPVGAGSLSQNISLQEYSSLFREDGLTLLNQSELFSNGNWQQFTSQGGTFGDIEYSVDLVHLELQKERPNSDYDVTTLYTKVKYQMTPEDSLFVMGVFNDASGGDLTQYYNHYSTAANATGARDGYSPTRRFESEQKPSVIVGYKHDWNPENTTLLIAGRLDEDTIVRDSAPQSLILRRVGGSVGQIQSNSDFSLDFERNALFHSVETQHIWQRDAHRAIMGIRGQDGSQDVNSLLVSNTSNPFVSSLTLDQDFSLDQQRLSIYSYYYWDIFQTLQLNAGVSYDYLKYPLNVGLPPIGPEEDIERGVYPKFGLTWNPIDNLYLRGAYTRSLGGALFDTSFRIEPTQVSGFTQAFRSLIPESISGPIAGTEFDTYGLSIDYVFPTQTYVGVEAQLLESSSSQRLGAFTSSGFPPVVDTATSFSQDTDFREKSLLITLNQLLGEVITVGGNYKITYADLSSSSSEIPTTIPSASTVHFNNEAWLHQISLDGYYNLPNGFFTHLNAMWTQQSNQNYTPDIPGDDFWQLNAFVGWRFMQRKAEVRLGIINITDQDYRLNPLTLYNELPRERMIAGRLKFNF